MPTARAALRLACVQPRRFSSLGEHAQCGACGGSLHGLSDEIQNRIVFVEDGRRLSRTYYPAAAEGVCWKLPPLHQNACGYRLTFETIPHSCECETMHLLLPVARVPSRFRPALGFFESGRKLPPHSQQAQSRGRSPAKSPPISLS